MKIALDANDLWETIEPTYETIANIKKNKSEIAYITKLYLKNYFY